VIDQAFNQFSDDTERQLLADLGRLRYRQVSVGQRDG